MIVNGWSLALHPLVALCIVGRLERAARRRFAAERAAHQRQEERRRQRQRRPWEDAGWAEDEPEASAAGMALPKGPLAWVRLAGIAAVASAAAWAASAAVWAGAHAWWLPDC